MPASASLPAPVPVEAGEPSAATGPERALGGPVLVALGAAGWGTEGLFRSHLAQRLGAYPTVLLEHVLQVLFTLPWLARRSRPWPRVSRRALIYVLLSGGVGSSLGTVCYTAALGTDVNKTAAAVLLNLQPLVSTLGAALLFGERIRRRFWPWASAALLAGMAMALEEPSLRGLAGLRASPGLALVGLTILAWGFATVAGRGAMRELPVGLAAPLRLWAGLATTGLVVLGRYLAGKGGLDTAVLAAWPAWRDLLLLTTVSGALPLFAYFAGLRRTPASIAGYCEMMYTVSASLVAWAFLGGKLAPHQWAAAAVLVMAIVQLNRGEGLVETDKG